MAVNISLVVSTLNEEGNIADCILSAKDLVNEIVIVDMQSEDRTVEIAKSLGATVYLIERKPFVDPTRNFAFSKANGEWILPLDADERITPALVEEFRRIAENDEADVVLVQENVYMFGRLIRYSGWQESYFYRFFKKGFLEYSETEVHATPIVKGRQFFLDPKKGKLIHYNYRDIYHFISKMKDYTDGEALKLLKKNGALTPLRGVYWGLRHFLRRYFRKKGYKDGFYGFVLCVFMGFYWFLAFSKAWEKKQNKC